jgi:hypothetical protein
VCERSAVGRQNRTVSLPYNATDTSRGANDHMEGLQMGCRFRASIMALAVTITILSQPAHIEGQKATKTTAARGGRAARGAFPEIRTRALPALRFDPR